MNIIQKDAKYLGRDVPATPIEIAKAKDFLLFDKNGKKYIDFVMGWCVGNLGWGISEIEKKISEYDGPDYVNPYYLFKPWADLAEILAEITPGKLTKSFRATGGTEAVEIALQAAINYTNRTTFISLGAYHGHSFGAMSIGQDQFSKRYPFLTPKCHKISPPFDKKAANGVVNLLKKREVAAFISEPIICNLGVVIPDFEFFEIVAAACKKYGTLFIMDEVATGFGRTGELFASELFGLKPDILCLAKGLTGGYGVLGATVTTDEVAKSMEYDFSFYSTFGWHPRNTVAALANLSYLLKNRSQILKNVQKMSIYFEKRLCAMKFKYPQVVRIKGLAIGVEFDKAGYTTELVQNCINNGLLVSDLGPTTITLFPALTIDQKTASEGLDILEKSA